MAANYEIFIDEASALRVLADVADRCGGTLHIIREAGFSTAIALLDAKQKYVKSREFNRFWDSNDGKDFIMVLASDTDDSRRIVFPGHYYPPSRSSFVSKARRVLEAHLWQGGFWKAPGFRVSDEKSYFRWTFVELGLLESWRHGVVTFGDPNGRYFEPGLRTCSDSP